MVWSKKKVTPIRERESKSNIENERASKEKVEVDMSKKMLR